MERINANEVQSMMEAYASIYYNQEQEVISEEVEDLDENRQNRARDLRAKRDAKAAAQDRLYKAGGGDAKRQETRQMQGASRARVRRPGMTRDQVIELGRKNLAAKSSTTTGTAPAAPANNAVASKAAPVKDRMADASKEDRMAAWAKANPKLAAAKAQRDAAKAARSGASAAGSVAKTAAKPAAAGAATGAAKPAGGKEDIFTSTPPGGKPYGNAAKPAPKPAGAPNRKEDLFTGMPIPSAGSAAKPAASTSVVKKPVRMGARNRMRMEELDVFETIKQYLVDEGYSEDEAIKAMTVLTDEERTEILEGNRPFSGAGEYPMRDAMRDAGMNNAPYRPRPNVPIKKAQKKPTTQMASYEPEGELVDEGSCGSKKKKKGGYGK